MLPGYERKPPIWSGAYTKAGRKARSRLVLIHHRCGEVLLPFGEVGGGVLPFGFEEGWPFAPGGFVPGFVPFGIVDPGAVLFGVVVPGAPPGVVVPGFVPFEVEPGVLPGGFAPGVVLFGTVPGVLEPGVDELPGVF